MFSSDEWTGRTGDAWADEWRRTDRSFTGLTPRLNAAILNAAPLTGKAVDLGCGAGQTSVSLASANRGLAVMGIDVSPNLIAIARERAKTANLTNADFRIADASALEPTERANLIVSRHGVMFFPDPAAAFARIRAAAVPGARLVFSCFRDRSLNAWTALADSLTGGPPRAPSAYEPGPFAFADRDFVTGLLTRAGWTDVDAQAVDFAYTAGQGDAAIADATSFFSRIGPVAKVIASEPEERRAAMADRLGELLSSHLRDGAVAFDSAAWIWTATAGV